MSQLAKAHSAPPKPPFDRALNWPEQLPVVAKREDISALIAANQVVIVAGETGSGKTTQLPKICLALGRGTAGLIGHTQPRRIAARAVAARVAEELGEALGESVGCQVRFQYQASESTRIKLMTDGILLAEIQRDRLLKKYDTIIIDEAHERSLNIDFLLGYLKQILPRRPDLKVIITSATIDVERFSHHFNNAPVISVEGRTYPVTIDYLPADALPQPPEELSDHIVAALHQVLERDCAQQLSGGDVLVFLSGERDILDVEKRLDKERRFQPRWKNLEIVPLFGRLSLKDQQRIFQPHQGRRIILSTNVAETSLTVPGIRYVIDAGTARISRYNPRNRIQRLPIEPISQAAANQRAGRSGRMEAGLCIRLYSEEDFLSRPAFTDPEILRTNLATVILQMLLLRLGEVQDFPFLDSPDGRQITEGYSLLAELKAVDEQRKLTPLGRDIAKLPLDPRIAAMLMAAKDKRCLEEVLVIASALSIQEPRERPIDKKQQADEKHKLFADERSDFLSFLHLWQAFNQVKQTSSNSALRRWCEQHFISFQRMREWVDVYQQLQQSAKDAQWPHSACISADGFSTERYRELGAGHYAIIHQALLVGLLSNVAKKDEGREYLACRQRKLTIFPGSNQAKRPPKWLMAAQLMETSQLFALCVAAIEPLWIIEAAAHLLVREHFEPFWDVERGQPLIYQRSSLFGLVIVERQKVFLGQIDVALARELLIREALVAGHYRGRAAFYAENQRVIKRVQDMEARIRRRDLLVDDDALHAFYAARLPDDIVTIKQLDYWYKVASQQQPQLLILSEQDVLLRDVDAQTLAQFPSTMPLAGNTFKLNYCFEPGNESDGVSVQVPLALLNTVSNTPLTWLVPGLLAEKVQQLLKNLPKQFRKQLVPLPPTAERLSSLLQEWIQAGKIDTQRETLSEALRHQLLRHYQLKLDDSYCVESEVDSYYRMNIQVVNERHKVIAQGRDLDLLQAKFSAQARAVVAEVKAASQFSNKVLKQFDLVELPEKVPEKRGQMTVVAWPALVDQQDSARIEMFDTEQAAAAAHRRGLTRLAVLAEPQLVKTLQKDLLRDNKVRLALAAFGSQSEVMQQLIDCAFDFTLFEGQVLPRGKDEFDALRNARKSGIYKHAAELEKVLAQAALRAQRVQQSLAGLKAADAKPTIDDMREQLQALLFNGFLQVTPYPQLMQYDRYMQAAEKRLEKLRGNVARDQQLIKQLQPYWQPVAKWLPQSSKQDANSEARWQLRWLIEEWRIALFAQPLRPLGTVSEKRIKELFTLCGFNKVN